MKGIILCVILCSVSLNAKPSGIDNRLGIIQGLRRRGGAATIGEEITGGVTGSISTSIGAIAGLALSILELIGGGIIGIGDQAGSGFVNGMTNIHNLRRSQGLVQEIENLVNSPQKLDNLRRKEIADVIRRRMDNGVTLGLLDGLRRYGGAATLGEQIAGGVTGSVSTTAGAITGLILSAIEAIGGGIVGVGDKAGSGLINGLSLVKNLRRSLKSERKGLKNEVVDEHWGAPCGASCGEPWDEDDDLFVISPDIIRSILLELGDLVLKNSGIGVVNVGNVDTGDVRYGRYREGNLLLNK